MNLHRGLHSIDKMVKAKAYIFKKHFVGLPKASDFELIEEELPHSKMECEQRYIRIVESEMNGTYHNNSALFLEFLAEAVYLSVDPYMRPYSARINTGIVFPFGRQVAKILESKHPKFPAGKYVVGQYGWRTHTVNDGSPNDFGEPGTYVLPDFGNLPMSLALGVLGMTGLTAYFGFLNICKPKSGETVVVSGAAGAVGSAVGQIAKIKGCKVIGIAGSDEKGKWLVDELGFDGFINYKTANLEEALSKYAPEGVDCYFDNVGGEISTTVLKHMTRFGRICVCGCISGYNEVDPKASTVQRPMINNLLKMEGFHVSSVYDKQMEGTLQNLKWVQEGKMKYRETITEGFENTLKALVDLLNGGNTGKALVKV